MINLNIHEVEKIELINTFIENGNCREVRVTYNNGKTMSLLFWGNTNALDALPRSEDFQAITKERR